MTNKERSASIRAEIKKLGYNSRQVSVRSGFCGYSDYTHVTIKDVKANIKEIEKACKKFQSVDYDSVTGEILAGGNTYIHVQYDYDAISKATDANIEKAESLVNEIDDYYVLFKNENKEIVLCKHNELFDIAVFEDGAKCGSVKVPLCSADRMKWTIARMFATNFAEVA